MKRLSLALLVACASISGFPQAVRNADAAKSLSPLETTLISQSKAIAEARKSKDVANLRRLLADDFHQVGSEGSLRGKSDLLDDAEEGNLKDFNFYDFKIWPVDDKVAIITYNAIIREAEGNEGQAPRYQRLSDVWVKDGEQWRLRFQQATAKRSVD